MGLRLFLIMNGIIIAWLVIGCFIFWSPSNNCDTVPDLQMYYYGVLVTLILGSLLLAYYVLILVGICTRNCRSAENSREIRSPDGKLLGVKRTGFDRVLSKTVFDPLSTTYESKCMVCLNKF